MRGLVSAVSACVLAAATLTSSSAFAAHVFDLDAKAPAKLSVIFTMAWFGIAASDPQPGGVDPTYGNWHQPFPQCGLANDPSTCRDFEDAGAQRFIASKRRPLAGIYSSSGRSAESSRRVDLMLATLRRPCADSSRIDAWGIQLDSIQFTSRYPQNRQSDTWDIAYHAVLAFLDRADAAHLENAVALTIDSTPYWHFGTSFGLSTQASRITALTKDIVDAAKIGSQRASALKVAGKPLLVFYVDAALETATEWQQMLDAARAQSGVDFYAIATTLDVAYFAAFDGLAPWVNLGIWASATGATLQARAAAYAQQMHAGLIAALANSPGRIVLGGVAPGFDDYTQNWGACTAREIPRDPAVLVGQFDALTTMHAAGKVKGLVLETWDDWTEGTEIEPDVTEGTAKLVALRQQIGRFYGEADDPAGDRALDTLWTTFGQARSCCFVGGGCADAGTPAPVEVACASDAGPTPDDAGGPGVDASMGPDGSTMIDGGPGGSAQPSDATSGCGCRAAPRGGAPRAWTALLIAVAALVRSGRFRRA